MGKLVVDLAALHAASNHIAGIGSDLDDAASRGRSDADFGSDTVATAHARATASHGRALQALSESVGSLRDWMRSAADDYAAQDAAIASTAR